ncbi:hexokinase-4-like isoform X2 [Haliotis asinina]|uniref:hexokinase-4-like isoform X2 n=1 Tax=Haliotis asinina TaxID=109174 RepID=UPI0035322AE2
MPNERNKSHHVQRNHAIQRSASYDAETRIKMVEAIVRPLILKDEDYQTVMEKMLDNFNQGLGKDTHNNAKVKMFQTYVRSVPDGTEEGEFLALDLGGTNFRVLLISLKGQEVNMESKIYLIPQQIMLGTGTQLFDHIADCIFKFMKEHQLLDKVLPLGFTFSFPCRQVGLAHAILTTWTKGFKCEGVEGNDIVQLLHEAIKRRGDIEVECLAVINDTVGALMSCAHSERSCAIGLILGTGTNACYIEKLENCGLWDADYDDPKEVIINTEWGAFGDDGALDFLMTDYDRLVDKHSINTGKQIYEKMISGMYMGEIARLVMERLRKNGLLFRGRGSQELSTRGRFYTKYVSEIESDVDDGFKNTKQVFDELNIEEFTEDDCRIAQYVCQAVSTRAAYLASAGIACLLNKMGRPEVVVGVDGSLYRFHPHFHDLMMEKVQKLAPDIRFKLMLSHDGSGKGAALVAAVANRLRDEKAKRITDGMTGVTVQD